MLNRKHKHCWQTPVDILPHIDADIAAAQFEELSAQLCACGAKRVVMVDPGGSMRALSESVREFS